MSLDTLAERTRSRRERPITELDGGLEAEYGETIDRIAGESHSRTLPGPGAEPISDRLGRKRPR